MTNARPIKILMAEDNDADVELIQYCMKKNKIHINLEIYDNGEDLVNHLYETKELNLASLPDIILLDIHLPGMSGLEVLQKIKSDDVMKIIPVAMLTSSKHDPDILSAYASHANCFLEKPLSLQSFQAIIDSFESFWFSIVTLPSCSSQ